MIELTQDIKNIRDINIRFISIYAKECLYIEDGNCCNNGIKHNHIINVLI